MKDVSLYRRLAADGNASAQLILDSEGEGAGAEPSAEMTDEDSEAQELQELQALAQQVGELVGKAQAHTEGGEHIKAGDAHFELGVMHENADDHARAKDSFKSAATSYKKQLTDCAGMAPEQIQAWHARENAKE